MTGLKIPKNISKAARQHLKSLLKDIRKHNSSGNIPEALNIANSFQLFRAEALQGLH